MTFAAELTTRCELADVHQGQLQSDAHLLNEREVAEFGRHRAGEDLEEMISAGIMAVSNGHSPALLADTTPMPFRARRHSQQSVNAAHLANIMLEVVELLKQPAGTRRTFLFRSMLEFDFLTVLLVPLRLVAAIAVVHEAALLATLMLSGGMVTTVLELASRTALLRAHNIITVVRLFPFCTTVLCACSFITAVN